MHNRALHDTLAAFVEEAAGRLAEEVSGGAEIPFDLVESGRPASPLYCYEPRTGRFIAERVGSLAQLPSYPAAARQLEQLDGLEQYLQARGRRASADRRRPRPAPPAGRAPARGSGASPARRSAGR